MEAVTYKSNHEFRRGMRRIREDGVFEVNLGVERCFKGRIKCSPIVDLRTFIQSSSLSLSDS